MDKLVYIFYIIIIGLLFYGASFSKKGEWNEGFMTLKQTKSIQGFCTVCILFHHLGQKTCANWLNPAVIRPGLEFFVPIGYLFVSVFLFCSGYGLYKSYNTKKHYLNGFIRKRILPIIVTYYISSFLFLICRMGLGEKMDLKTFILYFTGLKLCNHYGWYAAVVPLFYLAFYLCFKYFKNKDDALAATCLFVFFYTLVGTFIDHNDFWMKGEWWYNCVHLFSIGLIFARNEEKIVNHLKKHYYGYLISFFVLTFVFYVFSKFTTGVFSYYGQYMGLTLEKKVLHRWICLLSEMGTSLCFVTFVMMASMKIRIGNKVIDFMGTITLEFYLIHGLFVELFGFSFVDVTHSLYFIKNVFLFGIVVAVCAVPAAILLKKTTALLCRVLRITPQIKSEQ